MTKAIKRALSKENAKMLFAVAFLGGITMPILKILHMLETEAHHLDTGYLVGLISAGILGLVGHILIGSNSIRSALMDGIAAPTIIGNLMKSGAVMVTMTFEAIVPSAYAQDSTVSIDSTDTAMVIFIDTVSDTIPRQEQMQVQQQMKKSKKHYFKSFMKALAN